MKLPIRIFRVAERSMEPTIHSGAYVLANCLKPKVRPGDIVVIRYPKEGIIMVKRVSSINGDEVFIQGDNPKESLDSRHFGAVKSGDVIGKVIRIF